MQPDERLEALNQYYQPKSCKPGYLTVTDIAGLIKGASKGLGLGNAFLSTISSVDGIYHVVRGFTNDAITHVEGSTDAVRDAEIISDELRFKDIETLERKKDQSAKKAKQFKGVHEQQHDFILRLLEFLKSGKNIQSHKWTPLEVEVINSYSLITAKPVVFLLNVSESEYASKQAKEKDRLEQWISSMGLQSEIVPFCAEIEELVMTMGEEGKDYSEANKFTSALPEIIGAGKKVLGLIDYFTVGKDEVRAWTIRKNITAPEAAAAIHTDFEKAFQAVEVCKYAEFLAQREQSPEFKPLKFAKFGKKYIVEDGDILQFFTTLKK